LGSPLGILMEELPLLVLGEVTVLGAGEVPCLAGRCPSPPVGSGLGAGVDTDGEEGEEEDAEGGTDDAGDVGDC
jgi:hypothetical protein